MNINSLKTTKKNIYPGQIYFKGQFLDLVQSQDIDITTALNNLDENTKLIKNALNSLPQKEKEKYINAKSKKLINNEDNGLELDTLNCQLDDQQKDF